MGELRAQETEETNVGWVGFQVVASNSRLQPLWLVGDRFGDMSVTGLSDDWCDVKLATWLVFSDQESTQSVLH